MSNDNDAPQGDKKTQRVRFEFNERSLEPIDKLIEQGRYPMSNQATEPITLESALGDNSILTINILRLWDAERIKRFALHLLGTDWQEMSSRLAALEAENGRLTTELANIDTALARRPALDGLNTRNPPCAMCKGQHPFDTVIPSAVWNQVIRAQALPEYLCLICIVGEFAKLGRSFTAELFGADFCGTSLEIVIGGQVANDAAVVSAENTDLRVKIRDLEDEIARLRTAQDAAAAILDEGSLFRAVSETLDGCAHHPNIEPDYEVMHQVWERFTAWVRSTAGLVAAATTLTPEMSAWLEAHKDEEIINAGEPFMRAFGLEPHRAGELIHEWASRRADTSPPESIAGAREGEQCQ